MDKLAFTALNAVNERRVARQMLTNELANVATTGFKRSYEAAMQAVLTDGEGYATRISPQIVSKDYIDLSPGPLVVTGSPVDIAMKDQTVLGVQAPDGSTAFTRRGDLRVNTQGLLENGQGHAILSDAGAPISVPPGFALSITETGQLLARDPNAPAPQVEVPIAQLMLRDASQTRLVRREDSLFDPFIDDARRPGDFPTGPLPTELMSGALENSNVNPISAMVKLIDTERSFESCIKFIKEARGLDESGAQLLRA